MVSQFICPDFAEKCVGPFEASLSEQGLSERVAIRKEYIFATSIKGCDALLIQSATEPQRILRNKIKGCVAVADREVGGLSENRPETGYKVGQCRTKDGRECPIFRDT
jgi:hypothetical protein